MPGRKPSTAVPPSSSPHKPRRRIRNFWHTPAVILLEATAPYCYELIQEVHLRRQPQRIDLLILQRRQAGSEEISHLEALYARLGEVNLIELKGGTDELERLDVHTLLGYASQLRVSIERPPKKAEAAGEKRQALSHFLEIAPGAEIRLFVMAPTLSREFHQEVQRLDGALTEVSLGEWEGRLAGYRLVVLETERVWQSAPTNRLFYILTRGVIEGPELLEKLTQREEQVYNEVMDWLIQQPPQVMGGVEMRMEKIREYQARELERKQAWLNSLPPEEVVRRFPTERLVQALKPEERLKGLKPEERLKGLKPEEVLKSLSADEREALARLLNEGR